MKIKNWNQYLFWLKTDQREKTQERQMNKMDVFYNMHGIGDVLIVPLKQGKREEIAYEKYGDVVRIYDQSTGDVLGYNIFKASTHVPVATAGKIQADEDLWNKIKKILSNSGVEDNLDYDLSPKFVVGYVKEKEAHENADKLSVCQVDVGTEVLQIVCGAPNIDEGQHVVVAKVGAIMPGGMEIKPTNLRGVDSHGMICSKRELGLPDTTNKKGIYVLENSPEPGEEFSF